MVIVVSIATDEIRELREISFPNKQSWCDRHGYSFAGITQSLDPSRPPSWSKIKMLRLLCDQSPGSWAFCTDADAIVTRPDWKLDEVMINSVQMVATYDRHGLNAGNFLIRLGPVSATYLDMVYQQTAYINHRWWEQGAIRELIRSGYSFPLHFADKKLINAYPDDYKDGYSAILHVPDDRERWPDRIGELKRRLPSFSVAVP